MAKVKKIVLTGGPCAGKTTALVKIIETFSNLGYKVFTVPEVPTMVTQGGWNYLTDNHDFYYEGELAILELQLQLEDTFVRLAETLTEPSIVVCDRGALDISAYISKEMWQELCEKCGTTPDELLHNRYDAVLHLVSAADGAEKFYTVANNAQRYEQADEAGLKIARELDKKVITAWSGHPHHRVINNGVDFEHKLNLVVKAIGEVLELPQPVSEERKYIVDIVGEVPQDAIESEIWQTYLKSDNANEEIRIRRRCFTYSNADGTQSKSGFVNIHTTRTLMEDGREMVTERLVNNQQYEDMLKQSDPQRLTIHKMRKSFIYHGQFFELDTYNEPLNQMGEIDPEGHENFMCGTSMPLTILETKGIAHPEDLHLPPFLMVVKDVTGDKRFYNYNLALK